MPTALYPVQSWNSLNTAWFISYQPIGKNVNLKSLHRVHQLECFWECNQRFGQTHWHVDIVHQLLWGLWTFPNNKSCFTAKLKWQTMETSYRSDVKTLHAENMLKKNQYSRTALVLELVWRGLQNILPHCRESSTGQHPAWVLCLVW